MPWRFAFGSDRFHCGLDCTATLMAEHDNQASAQNIDPVLNASKAFIIEHIARHSNDEQIAKALIKDSSGWHTRIRTTKYDRERMLTLCQFGASFGGLLAGHSQRDDASIFIAVNRHVLSFVNRFVRVLRISGGKSPIPFRQPRLRLGRGNNPPIRLPRVSSAGKLICDKPAGEDEPGYELCLSHAATLTRCRLLDQFETRQRTAAKINEPQRNTKHRQR